MLLKLLPTPSASHPAPPTILFTLPLPNHPYTGRSLPLPPNLLAHRSVCLQEDIECPNVLLGEKSSWIAGIVDDVTFSLPAASIVVNLIDGSKVCLPLTQECKAHLLRVCMEVEMSFAPAPAPEVEERRPRSYSSSSHASTSSLQSTLSATTASSSNIKGLSVAVPPPSPRRSPSALLYSLISPLFPTNNSASLARVPPPNPARAHRRAARSLLVDTYRQFVLPSLKAQLPSAYLPWAIASETTQRMSEFEALKEEIEELLSAAGVSREEVSRGSMKRMRSLSNESDSSSSSYDSEDNESGAGSPMTPATSVFSSGSKDSTRRGSASNPQSFILSIPPAHTLPVAQQSQYAILLQRLTCIASRVHAIRRLNGKYEREEDKRRWLESLERGRLGDRALKKAYSNGLLRGQCVSAEPMRASRLWRSWTAEDQARASRAVHPAMMDDETDEAHSAHASDNDDFSDTASSSGDENIPLTPTGTSPIEPMAERLGEVATFDTSCGVIFDAQMHEEHEDEDEVVDPISPAPPRMPLQALPLPLASKADENSWNHTEAEVDQFEKLKLSPPPAGRRGTKEPKLMDAAPIVPALPYRNPRAPVLTVKPRNRLLEWAKASYDEIAA